MATDMTPEELTEAGDQLFPGLTWAQENDLATALNTPWSTVYQWKRGDRPIPGIAAGFIRHMLECEDYQNTV